MELASTPGVALKQIFGGWRGFKSWKISTLVDDIISLFRLHSPRTALGRNVLRAARAKAEEFDAMWHDRRSDIRLLSHIQASKKACLSGDGV